MNEDDVLEEQQAIYKSIFKDMPAQQRAKILEDFSAETYKIMIFYYNRAMDFFWNTLSLDQQNEVLKEMDTNAEEFITLHKKLANCILEMNPDAESLMIFQPDDIKIDFNSNPIKIVKK